MTDAEREAFEADARNDFAEIDTDFDGYITAAELRSSLTAVSSMIDPQHVETIINMADNDGDHKITLEEYLAFCMAP